MGNDTRGVRTYLLTHASDADINGTTRHDDILRSNHFDELLAGEHLALVTQQQP